MVGHSLHRLATVILTTGLVLWSISFCGYGTCDEKRSVSNVVIILADDLGYGDTSCYGARLVETPNIDRLAREGRRFTDAHTPSSVCSPTRYGLLTGRYCWRTPLQRQVLSPTAPLHVEPARLTLA